MKSLVNDKLGFYRVGDHRLESKIDACVLGTKLDVHPTWHFSDHVWHSQDWATEPSINILDLYQARARQIRENYDYVMLHYSGGSDSQTMVDAFLDSGCFIDEVVTIWNRKHTTKVILTPDATDACNVEAEYDLTTRPGLDRILAQSPRTKITYIDVSDATIQNYRMLDGEEWLGKTVEHLHPQYVTRWSVTRDKNQLVTLDRGLRTVVLFGTDKPKVCIRNHRYYTYFVDTVANSFKGAFNRPEYHNADYVFFYWSPDMPEIIIKQSHLIRRWFEANPHLKPTIQWPASSYNNRTFYEILVRSIIYPRWNLNTFQVVKSSSSVYNQWDNWFFTEFRGTAVFDSWFKGIEFVKNNVDQKYLLYDFDQRLIGFVGMINGFFALDPNHD